MWSVFNSFFKNAYLFLTQRERQSMSRGGAERGRHRIWNRLQALSCQHRAWRGAWTHRPRDYDLRQSRTLNRLSHPGTPVFLILVCVSVRCIKLHFNFFFFDIYFSLRERETDRERGRGRKRGRQNLKQPPGSELSAQSWTWGLNSQTTRSWPELKLDA